LRSEVDHSAVPRDLKVGEGTAQPHSAFNQILLASDEGE
jgi:hypothetical protein